MMGLYSSQYSYNLNLFQRYYLPLILRSWPVFVYAMIISAESILIEFLTNFLHLSPVLLSALSITLGGLLLLLVKYFIIDNKHMTKQKATIFSISKTNLLYASLALAIGVATWYDSVSRIGASKEVLLAGPLEVVLIVLLARMFLKERLDKIEIAGVIIAITGFFIAILSDVNIVDRAVKTSSETIITFGDIEAIVSAFGFALGVLFLTKLVSKHSSMEVAGASLLLSGILIGVLLLFTFQDLCNFISIISGTSTTNYYNLDTFFSTSVRWCIIIFCWFKPHRSGFYRNNRSIEHSHNFSRPNNIKGTWNNR